MLVVNALLCFALYVYKKHPAKFISSIISDFYSVEVISEAKELLLLNIEALKLDKWTRPPSRRGDNKRKHDLDDIIAQITLLDEGHLINNLPKYVIDNLDNVPLIRMERGEFSVIVSKLDKLSDDLNTHMKEVSLPGGHFQSRSHVSATNASISDNIRNIRDWAADSDVDTSDGQYKLVTSRALKKRKASSQHVDNAAQPERCPANAGAPASPAVVVGVTSYAGVLGAGQARASVGGISGQSGRAAASDGGPRRGNQPRVIGSSRAGSGLKAARPYVKKAIYAVYNVDRGETAESLAQFVKEELSVDVISCFETNLHKPSSHSKSFRLCINAKDNQLFLVPDKWCDGIVIKKWIFENRDRRQSISRSATAGQERLDQIDMENIEGGVIGAAVVQSAEMVIDPVVDNMLSVDLNPEPGSSRSSLS